MPVIVIRFQPTIPKYSMLRIHSSRLTPIAIATAASLLTRTPRKRPNNSVRCVTKGFASNNPTWNAYRVVSRLRTCSPTNVQRESRMRLNPSLRAFNPGPPANFQCVLTLGTSTTLFLVVLRSLPKSLQAPAATSARSEPLMPNSWRCLNPRNMSR